MTSSVITDEMYSFAMAQTNYEQMKVAKEALEQRYSNLKALIRAMRKAQCDYFKNRSQAALSESRRLEAAIDREVLEQISLF